MHKRTKGYTLLLLLVLTGLAGRISMTTVTSKERRLLIDNLKDSKAYLQKSIKGLSEVQLNFKAAPDKWSIKECVQHIALAENNLWNMAETALKQPATPEKKAEIKLTDAQVLAMVTDRTNKVKTTETFEPVKARWTTTDEAFNAFKDKRATLIKYAKTSTDDMRSHMVQMPFGYLDTYQLMLMIGEHTARHTMQIEEVKANQAFPK